ncbi:hypothetical protein B0I37DRAFT_205843 [Chaetomium sp. MPI-CAGE-AT-0009]|nr:hypothetical protein B0I37DRAFT_205843 [Chaetomium sp. MPI-CAGE-AT-0009]
MRFMDAAQLGSVFILYSFMVFSQWSKSIGSQRQRAWTEGCLLHYAPGWITTRLFRIKENGYRKGLDGQVVHVCIYLGTHMPHHRTYSAAVASSNT